jgi:hypothetical protein
MGLLYGRAGRLTAQNGGFRLGQWSNELPPGQSCTRQGFGGYFDGDGDYLTLPGASKLPIQGSDRSKPF